MNISHSIVETGVFMQFGCPACQTVLQQGSFLLQITIDGRRFYYAIIDECCDNIMPMAVLFDSQEPVTEAAVALIRAIRDGIEFESLPLVGAGSVEPLLELVQKIKYK